MGITVGLDCKLYRNTGTWGSPTWVAVTSAKDVNLNLEVGKAEAVARLSTFRTYAGTLVSAPMEFNMLADPALAEYDVFSAAVLARTVINFAMANGVIATTGTRYFKADYILFGWKRNEPLEEASTVDVTMDLAYSANTPVFTTV